MGYRTDPIGLIPIVYSKSSQLKWSEQSTIVLRIFKLLYGDYSPTEIDPHQGASDRRSNKIQKLWQQWCRSEANSGDQVDATSKNKLQGTIQAVHISKRRDGQLMGCAYVRFECNEVMARSMFQENGNRLVGKTVVVDWQPQSPKKRFVPWRCW